MKLVVANPRWKSLLALIGALSFVAAGAFIVLYESGLAAFLVGGAAIVFFGACAVVCAFQLIDRRPRLSLDDDGLFDGTLGVGAIAWRDIADAQLHSVGNSHFVCLRLRDPERWRSELPPHLQPLFGLHEHAGFATINVNLSGLGVDPHAVLALILKYSAMYEPGRG